MLGDLFIAILLAYFCKVLEISVEFCQCDPGMFKIAHIEVTAPNTTPNVDVAICSITHTLSTSPAN